MNQNYETPYLTAPAGVQYFTGMRPGVTGVQLRSPGCTEVTMKSDGVHPSQSEIKNLVGVEVLALKSDWVHSKRMKNSTGVGTNYLYSTGV